MTTTEMLLIRACKSYAPLPRLLSVYRRFYYAGTLEESYHALACILSGLVDKYDLISAGKMVVEIQKALLYYQNSKVRVNVILVDTMARAIRVTPVDKFPCDFRHKSK